jgi:hypothetical protein
MSHLSVDLLFEYSLTFVYRPLKQNMPRSQPGTSPLRLCR